MTSYYGLVIRLPTTERWRSVGNGILYVLIYCIPFCCRLLCHIMCTVAQISVYLVCALFRVKYNSELRQSSSCTYKHSKVCIHTESCLLYKAMMSWDLCSLKRTVINGYFSQVFLCYPCPLTKLINILAE